GLDVGAGTGIISSEIGAQVALDPSPAMLKLSHERKLDSVRGVGESLPFADGVFDFVLMATTICFLENPVESLLETRRVLKNHGSIAVCIIPKDSSWGRFYSAKGKKGHKTFSKARFYSVNEVKALLRECGFRPDMISSVLRYGPLSAPRKEEPKIDEGKGGFVCIRAKKSRTS
ncbi:MAG: class I SAM-dependent methyltransferase, partial [Methanomassiliicoccales archaeon]|nr:class I SAM-dependent methyltransferase [Methanomassiliicoccales archaeon]